MSICTYIFWCNDNKTKVKSMQNCSKWRKNPTSNIHHHHNPFSRIILFFSLFFICSTDCAKYNWRDYIINSQGIRFFINLFNYSFNCFFFLLLLVNCEILKSFACFSYAFLMSFIIFLLRNYKKLHSSSVFYSVYWKVLSIPFHFKYKTIFFICILLCGRLHCAYYYKVIYYYI